MHRAPIDLNMDKLVAELEGLFEAHGIQRLVVDTIGEMEQSIAHEQRRHNVMAALLELTRARAITAVFTRETSQIVGPELDFANSPLELLAENVVLLRYVEYGGALNRILSVLKMRDSAHDRSIRQYTIDGHRLHVLGAGESGKGVLTGIAELASERREKSCPSNGST
jgi:circadian clock protein KaiC